ENEWDEQEKNMYKDQIQEETEEKEIEENKKDEPTLSIKNEELSKGDFNYELNPFHILFTQANINSCFSDGFTIEETINDLVSGRLQPNDLPIIRI
ncbi:24132_t:CDS:2, partial [Gigaspora rosea]